MSRIIGPQWTSFINKVDTVGSLRVAMLGLPSSIAEGTTIRSATFTCSDSKFHLCAASVVLGKVGLLAAPILADLIQPECVMPLWVVIHSLQWRRQKQVLVK